MTLREFRKLIKGLPGDMDIAIETGEERLDPICDNTQVVKLKFNDTGEEKFVFIIKPCTCDVNDVIMGGLNMN